MADAFASLSSFIDEFFLNPLRYPDQYAPYNAFNTIAFALLALGAIVVIFQLLKRWKITIDSKFYWAIVPFIFFGSFTRVLVDAALLPRQVFILGVELFPFVTPYIYVLVFLIVILSLFVSKLLEKKGHAFTQTLQRIGIALAALTLLPLLLRIQYAGHVLLIAALALLALGVFEFAFRKVVKAKPEGIERMAVFGQVWDGAATFVGVGIGTPTTSYVEQHVVGNAIFDLLGGPFAFFLIKLVFASIVVYLIRRELKKEEEREEKTYILLLITIFGLAPGMRDAVRILVGV